MPFYADTPHLSGYEGSPAREVASLEHACHFPQLQVSSTIGGVLPAGSLSGEVISEIQLRLLCQLKIQGDIFKSVFIPIAKNESHSCDPTPRAERLDYSMNAREPFLPTIYMFILCISPLLIFLKCYYF